MSVASDPVACSSLAEEDYGDVDDVSAGFVLAFERVAEARVALGLRP